MDIFQKAKVVRLKSVHGKFLLAEEDEESVVQDRDGSARSARWTVEFVEDAVRLKSCYGKYLTASNQPLFLGMTGRKVLQTLPKRLDSSVAWEPVGVNGPVKLRTRYGQFLRANGGLPPWRNSVTHDIPHRTSTQEWILWEVHVVEILMAMSPVAPSAPPPEKEEEHIATARTDELGRSESFSRPEATDSFRYSARRDNNGRVIYFHISDENGEIDESFGEFSVTFHGSKLDKLKECLEDELGVEGLTVCARSPLNGKLYPLLLQLPPNNTAMHVVVVPPSSSRGDRSNLIDIRS